MTTRPLRKHAELWWRLSLRKNWSFDAYKECVQNMLFNFDLYNNHLLRINRNNKQNVIVVNNVHFPNININYTDGAPPWIPTNRGHRITSRPLKHDLKISPRDFKKITYWPYTNHTQNSQVIFIMHIHFISTFIINPFYIPDQTHTNTSSSIHEYGILSHIKTMPLS